MKARKVKKIIQDLLQGIMYIVIFGIVPFVAAFLVMPGDSPAGNAGLDLLKKLSVPSPENQKFWGMSSFELFGRPFIYNQNQPCESLGNSESRVFIPVWIEGEKLDGTKGKWIRLVHLTSFQDNTAVASLQENTFNKSKISNFQAGEEKPLATGKQFSTWLIWSLFGPGLLLLYSMTFFGDNLTIFKILQIIIGILSFPMAGYLGHVFFNSLIGIVLCSLLYLLIYLALYKLAFMTMSRLGRSLLKWRTHRATKQQKHGADKCMALVERGTTYMASGDLHRALKCFQSAYEIASDMNNAAAMAFVLSHIGDVYQMQGKYKEALTHFRDALMWVKFTTFKDLEVNLENAISRLQKKFGVN